MKASRIALALVLLAAAACGPVRREPSSGPRDGRVPLSDPRLEGVRRSLQSMVGDGEVVSVAVGVAHRGRVIWAEGFGRADREENLPAKPRTMYGMASLSKSLTATALFTLIEDGTIGLDDSVSRVIAPLELTDHAGFDVSRVTVRDILHGSGGIPHGDYAVADVAQFPDQEDLMPWMGLVAFPPGETWEYSNLTFGLQEVVIEQVTGLEFEDFILERLFRPLGMLRSAARHTEAIAPYVAARYTSSLERIEGPSAAAPMGGLGMFSSVHDLLRFGLFHLGQLDVEGRRPVGPANLKLMHDYEGLSEIFGLGWYNVNETLVSNGSATGTNSHLAVHRGQELVVVVLTNMTSRNAVTDTVADRIKEVFIPPLPPGQGFDRESYAAVYENPYTPDAGLLGSWSGFMAAPGLGRVDARLTFTPSGSVDLRVGDAGPVTLERLVYNTRSRFEGAATAPEFPPLLPEDAPGARIRLSLHHDGSTLTGYVYTRRRGETYGYALPVFVRLTRDPGSGAALRCGAAEV